MNIGIPEHTLEVRQNGNAHTRRAIGDLSVPPALAVFETKSFPVNRIGRIVYPLLDIFEPKIDLSTEELGVADVGKVPTEEVGVDLSEFPIHNSGSHVRKSHLHLRDR